MVPDDPPDDSWASYSRELTEAERTVASELYGRLKATIYEYMMMDDRPDVAVRVVIMAAAISACTRALAPYCVATSEPFQTHDDVRAGLLRALTRVLDTEIAVFRTSIKDFHNSPREQGDPA